MRFALVAVVSVGCSSLPVKPAPPPVAHVQPEVFATPGESLEYRIALRGITLGRLRVAFGELGWIAGKRAVIARARGESDGFIAIFGKLAYELHTTIDLDDNRPLAHREDVWIDVPGVDDKHESNTDGGDHDAHTAIALLRGWTSRPGERLSVRVRVVDASLDIETWRVGREWVPAAHTYAIRYAGMIEGERAYAAWISDDPARIPLAFQFDSEWGRFDVALVGYQLPP
jgi:hypothetical protein